MKLQMNKKKKRTQYNTQKTHARPFKILVGWAIDPGAVEFRRLTESNFHGVEVVD